MGEGVSWKESKSRGKCGRKTERREQSETFCRRTFLPASPAVAEEMPESLCVLLPVQNQQTSFSQSHLQVFNPRLPSLATNIHTSIGSQMSASAEHISQLID